MTDLRQEQAPRPTTPKSPHRTNLRRLNILGLSLLATSSFQFACFQETPFLGETDSDNTTATDSSITDSTSSSTTTFDSGPSNSTSSTSGSNSTSSSTHFTTSSESGTTSETDSITESESDTTEDPGCMSHQTCLDTNPAKPWCDFGSGDCVECLQADHCPDNAPICGVEENNQCGPCNRLRGQCPNNAACNFHTGGDKGTCLSNVWYVDASKNRSTHIQSPDGSQDKPFPTIAEAVNAIKTTSSKTGTLHIQGDHIYPETVLLNSDLSTIALFGDGKAIIQGEAGGDGLDIDGGVTTYLSNLRIQNAGDHGIDCRRQGTLWAEQLAVANSGENGVRSNGCSLTLDRSNIIANEECGIYAVGNLTMTNSIVGENGNENRGRGGGLYLTHGSFNLIYVTLVANRNNNPHRGKSIHCANGDRINTLRNAIIFGGGEHNIKGCGMPPVISSALDDITGINNPTNKLIDATIPLDQFFVDPNASIPDFRLLKPGLGKVDELMHVAQWRDHDPELDYENRERPQAIGKRDWPGADIAD